MLSRVLETLLHSMNFGQAGAVEPVQTPEPDYAREIAKFVLRWKRCPRCQKFWSVEPEHLEFLNANRSSFSESYRTVCTEGHRLFVTLFPSGTASMMTLSQDEITPFLPRKCGPHRNIQTTRVTPLRDSRDNNELVFIRSCGVSGHNHDEFARYYEKPGWQTETAFS